MHKFDGNAKKIVNAALKDKTVKFGVEAPSLEASLGQILLSQNYRAVTGKAPDIEGLTVEHLQYCHPSVVVLLAKLFQRIMTSGCVPTGFKYSYIVPIPTVRDGRSKAMKCDDFLIEV